MEETIIDNPAENSDDIVVETEALENEAEAVDDDQDGEESNDDNADDQETQESEVAEPVIDWEDAAEVSVPEFANETVLTALQGDARKAYESQLAGFSKYREQAEGLASQVGEFFDPNKTSVTNSRLASSGHNVRLLDVSTPEALTIALKEVVDELAQVDPQYSALVPVDEFTYIDPEIAKLKKQYAELAKQTQTAEAIREAELWKATKGNQLKTLVEQQLGVKVDTDLLYRVYRSGQRPTKASEILDAIGRTDFDAYKRLVGEKQTATKKAPPAASSKSNRSGGGTISITELINDPAKWREARLSQRQR
jgi:hypothetical protein